MKKILAFLIAISMMIGMTAAVAETTELPRNETLYYNGLQYGVPTSWSVIGSNQNNAMATTGNSGGSRTLMFETLYMYNMLDGQLTPLLADGPYAWNEDMTQLSVKLKDAAKWSDGTPVTAADVSYTFDISKRILNTAGANYGPYIDHIEVVDDKNLIIHAALAEDGKPINPLIVLDFLGGALIGQKAWIETVEARNNNDATAILADPGDDVVWSGPYTKLFANDQKVALVRDDNYWGQDASMWGKLPAPKYIVHVVYADNNANMTAFKTGEVDVAQSFLANVQDLWEKEGLPISTYMDEPPYGICANIPTAYFNMEVPVLQVKEVRKAIAMAVDYDAINQSAMTGQSPTFAEVPRSTMNPTDGEQAAYDHEAVKDLQWVGKDYEGAKALLESAGIVDSDGDGWREFNGEKIALNACCPNGWSDWQAAMEIVAAAGKEIGIDISTNYPEWSVYQTIFTQASQTELDIFMYSTPSSQPSCPWGRVRWLMSSEFLGLSNNWSGNFGHWSNERIDEIIAAIPTTTDAEELKALYTEANKIYLEEVPSFGLMYRPNVFHAVNESVWTNYPENGDGRNIPPTICCDGYGIAALYDLVLVNP